MDTEYIRSRIRTIPDFPEMGIQFKDITPLLLDSKANELTLTALQKPFDTLTVDKVVGLESRGFLFGPSLATKFQAGFVPARKKGKLPYKTIQKEYGLEYGKDTLEIHIDALEANNNVVLIDDVLATGGTISASLKMLETFKVNIIECQFLIEIKALKGHEKIVSLNKKYYSLINF